MNSIAIGYVSLNSLACVSLQERLSAATSQLQKYLPSAEGETQAGTEDVAPEPQQERAAGGSFTGDNGVQAADKSAGHVLSDAFSEHAALTSSRGAGEVGGLIELPLLQPPPFNST